MGKRFWGIVATVCHWLAKRLDRCRASAEEKRLGGEVRQLRSELVRLEEDHAREILGLREQLAAAEAEVVARSAEVEAFQHMHEHIVATLKAHTAAMNTFEALGDIGNEPRRRRS